MSYRIPALTAVRAFEAAARHGSFVKAAAELCVTHGAVSRQVKQLEEGLGVALFERRNRAVFLTAAGESFRQSCAEALRVLEQGAARAQRQADAPLRLSCEPTIAMRWLIPRLPAFQAEHPDIELLLSAAGGKVDFSSQRIDLALRRDDSGWGLGDHVAEVARERMGPVCAPARLLAAGGDWRALPLLHTDSRPEAWSRWLAAKGVEAAGEAGRFEHFYLSLQAAEAGMGLAIASLYMAADALRLGQLTAPAGFCEDGSGYVLLSSRPFDGDARRRAVLEWLRRQMALDLPRD
ncbi:LysR substrate-binding domain-containing protein [Chromobacterium haemolyticum]|uniref:LysR substrate-binding domain-containing protein n=1 Tax=Chromobacterium haemolyticum TaxID=394935 RepID=UPI0009DA27D7|nr:LysR substrate-binding domain-containing protein [Chromobacterium haemolyticum]OQS38158.1 LysR family transcriptional regulator [Chromobacterium haemolyticum]